MHIWLYLMLHKDCQSMLWHLEDVKSGERCDWRSHDRVSGVEFRLVLDGMSDLFYADTQVVGRRLID